MCTLFSNKMISVHVFAVEHSIGTQPIIYHYFFISKGRFKKGLAFNLLAYEHDVMHIKNYTVIPLNLVYLVVPHTKCEINM